MRRRLSLLLVTLVFSTPAAAQRGGPSALPQDLARIWDAEHVSPPLPPLLTHAEVVKRLEGVVAGAPDLFRMEKVGESV